MKASALIFAISVAGCAAYAQAPDLVATVKRGYTECAYNSVAAQLKQQRTTDYSMVSEMALQACATEEQLLKATLATYQMRPDAIELAVLQTKMEFKRSIRDIAAHPEKYAR